MKDIIIVGAGGFGREVYSWLWDCFSRAEYGFKGFLADNKNDLEGYDIDGPILDGPAVYRPASADRFVLAIGNVEARRRTVELLLGQGAKFLTMIHPTALVAQTARLGSGAVLYPYSLVSNGAVLDDFVHLSLYASVGHDGRVGQYCALSPYSTLNGFAVLEDEVLLGTHASVAPTKRVGRGSKISSNSAVMKDVPPGSLVFGVPGRHTRRLDIS